MSDTGCTVITSINVVLHAICLILLQQLHQKSTKQKPQPLYLISLSASEFLLNLCSIIVHLIPAKILCITRIPVTAVFIVYVGTIFLITADRLAACLLKHRYRSICTLYRVKVVILSIWGCSFLVTSSAAAIVYLSWGYPAMNRAYEIFFYIVVPVIFIIFFLYATTIYVTVFVIYVRSERRVATKDSMCHIFINSKFKVALLIVATFLVLMVGPYLMLFVKYLKEHSIDSTTKTITVYLATLSDTIDAFIYIVVYQPVTELLRREILTVVMWCSQLNGREIKTETSELLVAGRLAAVVPLDSGDITEVSA